MKNRNIPYYVAALMLAAGVSTSFVSCVDTDEPSSIEELRKAKANEVNAQAAYKNALAQTQLQTAEIQKQKAAQEAIQTQIKELDRQAAESNLTLTKATNELEVLKKQNGKVEENARAAIQAVKDGKNLNAEQIKAINVAIKYEAEVAAKEDSIKYLKDKYAAELASSAAKLQKTIAETKEALTKLEMHTANREAELTDSLLVVQAETDEIAKNVLTAKTNAEGLLTATFDAWVQAKFNVVKAQAKLAEEKYKAAVHTAKDTISLSLAAATETAKGGVETQKLAVTTAEDNLKKLQDLKDKTDYQSWVKAYNDADNYIKVDITNKDIKRQETLAEKKNLQIVADNDKTKAEAAYKAYTDPFENKLKDYDAKSAFYKYDISAADYATLVSYITDKKGAWTGKAIASSTYTIEQAKDTKAEGQHFVYDAASKQFVSIEQEITNAKFKTAIAELYAVDDNDPENQEKITGVIGQFIAKTKADKNSKKTAEETLKEQEKNLFRSENVTAELDLTKITDERALVKIWNDAKTNYNTALTNLRTKKEAYNTAKDKLDQATEALKGVATTDPNYENLNNAKTLAQTGVTNAAKDLNGDGSEKGAIETYNDCATAFGNACKSLFGDDYADEKNKFATTSIDEKDLEDVKFKGRKLQETVEGGTLLPTGLNATTTVKTAPRFVFELPDRLKAEELSVILDGKTLADYDADIYNNAKFGINNDKALYVKYLRQKNVVVPEWTNKIKADEEAAKFVSTVKSHVNVADAATAELSIVETLKQLVTDRAKLQTAVYEARYTEEGKKLLAEVESKKAAATAAADSVAKYEEYKDATTPKAIVDQAIKEEKAAKENLMKLYKGLIEAAFKKTGANDAFTYDPEKYADAYAKAEINLKKALEDAKADLTVAEAELEAAKKGEVYKPAEVKSPIVSVSQVTKDGNKSYEVSSVDQTILADGKTYEAYIEALGKAVTETQANVDDLNTQYEAAKKLYEEAMKQVAEYTKAK